MTTSTSAASGGGGHDERQRVGSAIADVPLDLYDRLRDVARKLMRGEAVGHTLQTTSLVHEAYLRLVRSDPTLAESPSRLLAIASDAMRNALIDHARRRMRLKRGGGHRRELIDLEDLPGFLDADPTMIVALEEALEALRVEDDLAARIVQMRFHLGLGVEDTARAIGSSPRTVKRRWAFARAWLFRRLAGQAQDTHAP